MGLLRPIKTGHTIAHVTQNHSFYFKSEALNPKLETNTNSLNTKLLKNIDLGGLVHLNFGFV